MSIADDELFDDELFDEELIFDESFNPDDIPQYLLEGLNVDDFFDDDELIDEDEEEESITDEGIDESIVDTEPETKPHTYSIPDNLLNIKDLKTPQEIVEMRKQLLTHADDIELRSEVFDDLQEDSVVGDALASMEFVENVDEDTIQKELRIFADETIIDKTETDEQAELRMGGPIAKGQAPATVRKLAYTQNVRDILITKIINLTDLSKDERKDKIYDVILDASETFKKIRDRLNALRNRIGVNFTKARLEIAQDGDRVLNEVEISSELRKVMAVQIESMNDWVIYTRRHPLSPISHFSVLHRPYRNPKANQNNDEEPYILLGYAVRVIYYRGSRKGSPPIVYTYKMNPLNHNDLYSMVNLGKLGEFLARLINFNHKIKYNYIGDYDHPYYLDMFDSKNARIMAYIRQLPTAAEVSLIRRKIRQNLRKNESEESRRRRINQEKARRRIIR